MVIDTSIIIDHLRSKDKLTSKLYQLSDEPELCISAVSMYELYMGATSKDKEKDIKLVTESLIILPFTNAVALQASKIYHQLKKKNELIEFRDIFIAATCMVNELPIATLNKKHFKRIEGLKILR
ncbi:MAG TPA: type II toxin-antitoxin system VapC family toxin [Mucilaginibacter sp.]|jgi:predicted nucleic acid-binding protein